MANQGFNKDLPTCLFCLPFYWMAALGLCFEFLPRDAFAIFGANPPSGHLRFTLTFAAALLVIAVALHVVCYWLSPARFNVAAFRSVGLGVVVVLACMFGLSIALTRGTGLPPAVLKQRFETVLVWAGVAASGTFVVLIAALLVLIRLKTGNRMARRIAVGDYAAAIRLGEARPPAQRDFITMVNLVTAYTIAGDRDKAKSLLATLEQVDTIPKYYTAETFKQTIERLAEAIDQGPQRMNGQATSADL
ncbi:MAG: hypothetical protein ABI353_23020 [Isosphaeraceae bacterium]